MKSTSLRTAGRGRCRSALGRCRLTRRKNTQPSSPKLGACCAVAQFTCGPARQRGIARHSLRPSAGTRQRRANRSFDAARRGSGAGGQWQLDAPAGTIHERALLTAEGVASSAGVMATKTWKNRGTSDGWSTAGDFSVGGTLDMLGTIGSGVVQPLASSFASDRKIEDAKTSATAVAVTSPTR